ncbi:2,4-dienoyl-CoA reductase [Lentibacillus kapialis]|uniref:Peroxisomal trans-2-enoyl-CoA reductase n=1 Tax=Lentibacillus kapialis TaxID=340214 RepID=A0A917PVB0_9BACI|nr:SDR family oxidoreductase [Lentibacillus kapialis]GGJ93513.1 2,4-dienoyl-CoA reductase [Lentibacillus kapialis]
MKQEIFAPGLLTGKSVLITGGGTGIGLAMAQLLGELGAHVILVARTAETLEEAVTKLHTEHISADCIPVNIREEQEVTELFDTVSAKWGGCDFLINNAGGQFTAQALNISANGFRSVVDLNLQGTWQMSSAFARMLIEKGRVGRIINIVLCLQSGVPGMVHAGAARAGVMNMTKTLAYEWGEHGILVNAIAPGTIATSGLKQYNTDQIQKGVSRLPVSRIGRADEIAMAAAYLLSPAGSYITGTTLEVDGGEHLLGASDQIKG